MCYETKPSAKNIKKRVADFYKKKPYEKENYLASLELTKAFLKNDNYRNIFIKVNFINSAFKTNIRDTSGVARTIYQEVKDVDMRLKSGDTELVNEIANYKSPIGKSWHFNSFATKFCHCHRPELFPINDKYVRKSLFEFNRHHKFSKPFREKALFDDYYFFKNVYTDFIRFVHGDKLDMATIDRFLWALGREQEEKRKNNKNKEK
jgi:hypothetical protein